MTNSKTQTMPMTPTQEIEKLRKFAATFGELDFLKELFTEDFLGWVSRQVECDVMPDMFQWWTDEVRGLNNRLTESQNEASAICRERDRARDELNEERHNTSTAEARGDMHLERALSAEQEVNRQYSVIAEKDDQIAEQAAELLALKAKLWDLTNPKTATE